MKCEADDADYEGLAQIYEVRGEKEEVKRMKNGLKQVRKNVYLSFNWQSAKLWQVYSEGQVFLQRNFGYEIWKRLMI